MTDYVMLMWISGRRKTDKAMYSMVGVMSEKAVAEWRANPANAGKEEKETIIFERMADK